LISKARLQAASRRLAELVGQPDHAETSPIALFGVLAATHHDVREDRDVRPDTGGPHLDALRRPVLAEPVVRGHVIALRVFHSA